MSPTISHACVGTPKDRGAVAGEYSVILALITLALVAAVGTLSLAITGNFQAVANLLP